jgi:hypothetical protein
LFACSDNGLDSEEALAENWPADFNTAEYAQVNPDIVNYQRINAVEEKNEQYLVALRKRYADSLMTTGADSATAAGKASALTVSFADPAEQAIFFDDSVAVKKIFTDYRRMCEREVRKPILLFNEADALFSKRRDVDLGNTAQTENALQNILLEELESLDGILIATTNLCENFDAAFERRFLFKVKFGQPSTEAKKSIWKSKLSWLSDEECDRLATRYDLSGGEIDNIVRKNFMEQVISGQRPSLEMIEEWCRSEKLTSKASTPIGYAC